MTQTIIAVAAALAAMSGWAGESAEFRLDTMDGTRTARAVETIAYSTAWNGGGTVSVAVDGVAIKEANAPASGDVVWNAAQATPGTHTLTHTCGGDTLTAVFEVASDVVVHFDANGGVFRRGDGTTTNRFDQYFTYGEAQKLFTDELTPMKMDESGNRFVGWVRDSPEYSSPEDEGSLFGEREMQTWYDDVTEVTFYAVWTTTMTVSFYNDTDGSGNSILTPDSLAEHLRWSLDGGSHRYKCGESVQVIPGRRLVRLHADEAYRWLVGRIYLDRSFPDYNTEINAFVIYIGNDFGDPMIYGTTPKEEVFHVGAVVGPTSDQECKVRFLCAGEKVDGHVFDPSKARISLTYYGQDGNGYVSAIGPYKPNTYYLLPCGVYYVEACVDDGKWKTPPIERLTLLPDGPYFKNVYLNFAYPQSSLDCSYSSAVKLVPNARNATVAPDVLYAFYHVGDGLGREWMEIPQLPNPERPGYEFTGWWTSPKRSNGRRIKATDILYGDDAYGITLYAHWTDMSPSWISRFISIFTSSGGDIATAANMTAANGCRTVGECYALGIDPEDPDDDLKITDFRMNDGKPVITLNHTEDGSGNSFLPRVKTVGKADISDATEEWREVPEEGDPSMRFFKVEVEMP